MHIQGNAFLVTGGVSGLGEAVVRGINEQGGNGCIVGKVKAGALGCDE